MTVFFNYLILQPGSWEKPAGVAAAGEAVKMKRYFELNQLSFKYGVQAGSPANQVLLDGRGARSGVLQGCTLAAGVRAERSFPKPWAGPSMEWVWGLAWVLCHPNYGLSTCPISLPCFIFPLTLITNDIILHI